MLMAIVVNLPMVQVQHLKINQQRVLQQTNQQRVPQKSLKVKQAIPPVLLQPLKPKQTLPQQLDNFIPVKHFKEFSCLGLLQSGNDKHCIAIAVKTIPKLYCFLVGPKNV